MPVLRVGELASRKRMEDKRLMISEVRIRMCRMNGVVSQKIFRLIRSKAI